MRRIKTILLVTVLCMSFGITAMAETKNFAFSMKANQHDSGNWTAVKADGEQKAYITPTSISGKGTIWAAVYNPSGGTQYTADVGISNGEANVKKATGYYLTGYAGNTYRIMGGDSEGMVTSSTFTVNGRWTP